MFSTGQRVAGPAIRITRDSEFRKSARGRPMRPHMVSLRRFLGPRSKGSPEAWKGAYQALLDGISDCAVQVCQPVSGPTRASLAKLQEALSRDLSAEAITETGHKAETELRDWRDRASRFYKQKASEVKELMKMIARTAELVAERDRRYGPEFQELAAKLQSAADIDDLAALRSNVLESVAELNRTVERMHEEGRDTVAALQAEITNYRSKLEVTEQAAWIDPLTGAANRRRGESEIARRIGVGRHFCLMMADLNGLKRVNDSYGHNAGDELLRHFADELQHVVRASDLVARWGGDEFVVILECDRKGAEGMEARIRQWAFGAYTLKSASAPVKVELSAALGFAQWEADMTQAQLVAAADQAMYKDKASHRIARLE